MKCKNEQLGPVCGGEVKPSKTKAGFDECVKCGYRTKSEAPKVEMPKLEEPKPKKNSVTDKEN
jgi:hypothetical protein